VATILIVDDEFNLAELLGELLALRGHTVALALNGAQGLEHLKNHTVDLVISDVMMPIMSGKDMVAAMQATPELAGIPVILMSAVPHLLTAVAAEVPLRATLLKPFAPTLLYATIARALAEP